MRALLIRRKASVLYLGCASPIDLPLGGCCLAGKIGASAPRQLKRCLRMGAQVMVPGASSVYSM